MKLIKTIRIKELHNFPVRIFYENRSFYVSKKEIEADVDHIYFEPDTKPGWVKSHVFIVEGFDKHIINAKSYKEGYKKALKLAKKIAENLKKHHIIYDKKTKTWFDLDSVITI